MSCAVRLTTRIIVAEYGSDYSVVGAERMRRHRFDWEFVREGGQHTRHGH